MKWPKGKYNGFKIEGFEIKLRVKVLSWRWLPVFSINFGEPYFIWLCFYINTSAEYKT